MYKKRCFHYIVLLLVIVTMAEGLRHYSRKKIIQLREEVRAMFHHAYDGYLRYASDYDELRPLTCDGVDTWGSYSLTLIDALDTLATMGNFTEFRRVATLLQSNMDFNKDINVSVFETNIRVLGGLLSAHMLSKRAGVPVEAGWPCRGPLLRLAEDIARRLLPAFETATGMPYGTVNLRYGVPKGETPVTCTAGVGTFLIEFGTLSRLTGNPIYEEVAINAIYSLWERRSPIGLFGNHIDVQTGRWTAMDAGIGAGVDSFFEYLVKGAILLNRPNLLEMFHEARAAIDKYLKRDGWYVWVGMNKGQMTLPIFQSLEAFWPGILSMIGDTAPAMRTLSKYSSVWRQYGFLPEFYNIITGEPSPDRESYPLRPELVESTVYLYRATKNQFLLEIGENMLRSIEYSARTKCGYSTIRNVITHEKENRMESFFLAETTKYLYLLFDEENFLHNDASSGEQMQTENGECVVHTGPYIFNTEAHPVDMSALYCCHDIKDDIYDGLELDGFSDGNLLKVDRQKAVKESSESKKYECGGDDELVNRKNPIANGRTVNGSETVNPNIAVDIEIYDENNNPAADILIENFEKIKNERHNVQQSKDSNLFRNQVTVEDLKRFFNINREEFASIEGVLTYIEAFMRNYTLDAAFISGLQILDKGIIAVLGGNIQKEYEGQMRTLWELYELEKQYAINVDLLIALNLTSYNDDNQELLKNILSVLNGSHTEGTEHLVEKINLTRHKFESALVNTTAMQEFLLKILINGTADKTHIFKAILREDEIAKLPVPKLDEVTLKKLYDTVRRIVEFKKHMIETFAKLQELMLESEKQPFIIPSSTMRTDSKKSDENDDLIIATEKPPKQEDYKDKQENLSSKIDTKAPNNESLIKQKSPPVESKENAAESLLSQLVQTILRKTTTPRRQFDEHLLLLETRKSLQKYGDTTMRYDLFSCRRPAFADTFAYREFYP